MVISRRLVLWLFKHSFYPTFIDDKKGFRFGTLPWRKSINRAIKDAVEFEEKE